MATIAAPTQEEVDKLRAAQEDRKHRLEELEKELERLKKQQGMGRVVVLRVDVLLIFDVCRQLYGLREFLSNLKVR